MNTGILDLPDEIIVKIFKYNEISIKDLVTLCEVCQRFRNIGSLNDIWKSKFIIRWTWIWKNISNHESEVSDWKMEVRCVLLLKKKLNEKLNSLNSYLYKNRNLTVPVIKFLKELFKIGEFGSIYMLNELRSLLEDKGVEEESLQKKNCFSSLENRSRNPPLRARPNWTKVLPFPRGAEANFSQSKRHTNLTKKYYGQLILQFIHKIRCEEEWQRFFALPAASQTLERGAFLFAKWFQAEEFLNIEYAEISSKLDGFAKEALSYLKTNHPKHRAVSHTLIHPDDPLDDTIWSKEECEDLLRCINHTLFVENKFKGNQNYYLIENSFINKVIEMKKGIPVTLSIIYYSVCHRLGIVLYPVSCPSHFMLKWRIPTTDRMEYIDAFHEGKRTNATSLAFDSHPNVAPSRNFGCNTIKVLERMTNNTLHVAQRNLESNDRFTEMCLTAEISVIFDPDNEDLLKFLYSLYLSIQLHSDRVISGCNRLLQMKPWLGHSFDRLKEEAENILEEEMKGPPLIFRNLREAKDPVNFATGMVMSHKLYGYKCVITGWDQVCKMPLDWIIQMNVFSLKYQNKQPFYSVLVDDGSWRYVAQENLFNTDPVVINHKEIGRYFEEFNGHYYVPNAELRLEYPDECDIRKKYYPTLN